jgi:hypothetical protein
MKNGQSRQHCQERLSLRLDRLGQQPAGTTPQDGGQPIFGLIGPPEWDSRSYFTQRL